MPLRFDNTYARLPPRFYAKVAPTPVAAPRWLATNPGLGALLGLEPGELTSPELLAGLAGAAPLAGAEPLALAYAGHQFGGFVPQLGDGRAILLGEVVGADGRRRDVQLKGSGPTPFSRGGDGRAAIGPVLREFLVSEAMHALGVPTTRSLAAVATGEPVYRERALPGAVLTRVASSHLRVGTFEYFACRDDRDALAALVDVALRRHYPERLGAEVPALALLDAVVEAQIALVSHWLALGFVHGVMNTDNCSIAGETIDYGPCAFLDVYDPNRTFSSIDHHGRYAFANQPRIALWNLARLAEALLPLIGEGPREIERLEARLGEVPDRFAAATTTRLREKLGLREARDGDRGLADALLTAMAAARADHTLTFRALADHAAAVAAGADAAPPEALRALGAWLPRWEARFRDEPTPPSDRAESMRRANPAFIPRNHLVEAAIAAAMRGDLGPFTRLHAVLARPYDDQPEHADLQAPPGDEQWSYRTFCGT